MVGHHQLGRRRRPARGDHVACAIGPVGAGAAQAVIPGRFDGAPELALRGSQVQLHPVAGAGQVEPAQQFELEPDDVEVRPAGADVAAAEVALETPQADVVAATLEHRPSERARKMRLQGGQLSRGELLLEGDGVGRDHRPAAAPLDPDGERGEVAKRLPHPRSRLDEEASAALQALSDGPCHLLLGLPILVTRALRKRAAGTDQGNGGVGQGPEEKRVALAPNGIPGAGGAGVRRSRSSTRRRRQALAARVGAVLQFGVRAPLGHGEVEEVPERRPRLGGHAIHLREGRPPQGGGLHQQPSEQLRGRLRVTQGAVGTFVMEPELTAQCPEVVAGGERQQDAPELERVHRHSPTKGIGEELAAEGEVKGGPVADQLGILAELGELDHGLERGRLAGQIGARDTGQPLHRQRHRDARVDQELKLADGHPVLSETDGPDLDDPLALGRQPGGLEIEGDELDGHQMRGGVTAR